METEVVTPETVTPTESTPESVAPEVDIFMSQGIDGPSEAELRGEDITPDDEPSDSETSNESTAKTDDAETPETEETSEEQPKEDDEQATEETTADSEPEAKRHPKGYVPIAAIHEARGEVRYLKEQLQTVQNQLHELKQGQPKEGPDLEEFEVLSDDEFDILAEDDPGQAAIYLRNLSAYEAKKRSDADAEHQQKVFAEAYESIMQDSMAAIEKIAPGIYDEDSQIQSEIMEFAESFGFTEDMYYLTNPSTKVILPGETEPVLLGEQAADILGLLVNAKSKMATPDTSALESRLREEITAELVKKFKSSSTDEYRSLSQAPKSDTETPSEHPFRGKVLSTEELTKLTPKQYEEYLAGN